MSTLSGCFCFLLLFLFCCVLLGAGLTCSLLLQVVASPFLAALAVSIGAPVLLCYVYGVVPVAMCRSRGCGVLNAAERLSLDELDNLDNLDKQPDQDADQFQDNVSLSHRGVNPSIGEVSISMGSGSQLERLGRDPDMDLDRLDENQSVSNVAIAGASLTGQSLAGSIASSLLPGCGPAGQRWVVGPTAAAAAVAPAAARCQQCYCKQNSRG